MIRGIIKNVVEGKIKRFSASGRIGEEIDDREYLQHYGYTSRPKEGAEIIIIREGNHLVAIASDDRRYRLSLQDGEVALYDDRGQKVHLTRSGIVVTAIGTLQASATESATITAPQVKVVASVSVTLDTPVTTCTGLLHVNGNIVTDGNVSAVGNMAAAGNMSDSTRSMAADRTVFNNHKHQENGVTNSPLTTIPTTQQ
ncbi:MAG: phage baseplate assembly protein V [Geobacteraceae bacterium]|nr:phage baseplate assembly protein V [Geobacteraceae bacterium]